jgi:hypothetical protein
MYVFIAVLRIETRASLAKQALYHLSYAPAFFFFLVLLFLRWDLVKVAQAGFNSPSS